MKVKKQFVVEIREYVHICVRKLLVILFTCCCHCKQQLFFHRMAQNTLWEFLLVRNTHTLASFPSHSRSIRPSMHILCTIVCHAVFFSSFSHIIRSFYLRYYVKIIFCERNHCLAGHHSFTLIAKFVCSTADSK